MRNIAIVLLVALVGLSGCVNNEDGDSSSVNSVQDGFNPAMPTNVSLEGLLAEGLQARGPMIFTESIVSAGVDRTGDLYEPTMEVCDDGSIYITGHTIAVDTTGAPVYGSHNGGLTWEQLPWFQDQHMPGDVQGATPPVSDEIFLACGDNGYLYGSDITLASYPVNAWSDYGAIHDYWNFNAYDETKAATQAGECTTVGVAPAPAPVKDRPWSAYSNGTLLLTSNPAGGANQIGVVSAPFVTQLPDGTPGNPDADYSFGHVVNGVEWNLCAGPGGSIPGVPDISKDGLIAAPQRNGNNLVISLASKDNVMEVDNKVAFNFTTIGEITSVYGHATFDADDNLFVGISNNTRESYGCQTTDIFGETTNTTCTRAKDGGMVFATSTDGGETFVERRFQMDGSHLRHFYMDANDAGPGALVVWAVNDKDEDGNNTGAYDWYFGHLMIGEQGEPYFAHVGLGIENGPAPSAHVTGAAVGPDGASYTAMYTSRSGSATSPTTPLSVYIQTDGPFMPVYAAE